QHRAVDHWRRLARDLGLLTLSRQLARFLAGLNGLDPLPPHATGQAILSSDMLDHYLDRRDPRQAQAVRLAATGKAPLSEPPFRLLEGVRYIPRVRHRNLSSGSPPLGRNRK